jgi:rRNA maturation RNase YbeY
MLNLKIFKTTNDRLPASKLKALFVGVTEGETKPNWRGRVNVVFTDDRSICKLNKTHRGKDKPTDVLSFPVDPPDSPSAVFGEIYISVPTATRQAAVYGGTLTEEFLRLFCHGLLHLFGYDHMNPSEAKAMQARERKYLGER